MITKIFLLLTCLSFSKVSEVTDCQSYKSVRTSAVVQKQQADDYVVLPLSQMWDDNFKSYSSGKLTRDDFATIEVQLRLFTEEYNEGQGKKHSIELRNYKRQYICGINKKGDKEVWVNCFCKDNVRVLKYWKKQAVMVMDGGKCFFNLKINLTKKIKYNVIVNGVA